MGFTAVVSPLITREVRIHSVSNHGVGHDEVFTATLCVFCSSVPASNISRNFTYNVNEYKSSTSWWFKVTFLGWLSDILEG